MSKRVYRNYVAREVWGSEEVQEEEKEVQKPEAQFDNELCHLP